MNTVTKKQLERGGIFSDSLKYSEEFGFDHADTLREIRKLTMKYPIVRNWFQDSTLINERNREYPYVEMTRDGYIFLIMQMGNAEKQQLFIKAFNEMEHIIAQQSNTEWKESKKQSKIARRTEPDVIKEFVKYAQAQGSTYTPMYYKHFTNATYKALSLLESKKPKTRDTLDVFQLSQLVVAESIVKNTIKKAMDDKVHYKVIYELAKHALDDFARVALIRRKDGNR